MLATQQTGLVKQKQDTDGQHIQSLVFNQVAALEVDGLVLVDSGLLGVVLGWAWAGLGWVDWRE